MSAYKITVNSAAVEEAQGAKGTYKVLIINGTFNGAPAIKKIMQSQIDKSPDLQEGVKLLTAGAEVVLHTEKDGQYTRIVNITAPGVANTATTSTGGGFKKSFGGGGFKADPNKEINIAVMNALNNASATFGVIANLTPGAIETRARMFLSVGKLLTDELTGKTATVAPSTTKVNVAAAENHNQSLQMSQDLNPDDDIAF